MRITNSMLSMTYSSGISNTLNKLLDQNKKVASGRSLLNPEDDPVYYISAYSMQIMSNEATQYGRNVDNASAWLGQEDSVLQSAYDYISKAKNELGVEGANDSQNADSRKAIAGDVLSVLNAVKDIGNTQYMGRYLFSGYKTDTQPFTSGDRQVTAVVSSYSGTEVIAKKLYSDMPELKQGAYTANVTILDGVAYTSLYDSNDKAVLIDSNSSDDTTKNGNLVTTSLVTAYDGSGTVINTGTGVGIQLPDGISDGQSIKLQFYYTPGDDITYQGDNGLISSKIASNQSVNLNVDGQSTFMKTNRTVTGTMQNTSNGIPISNTTKFSQIDGANANLADSIKFSGTDHNGYSIGTARLSSPGNVNLDMLNASDAERTVTLGYAGRSYDITMAQKGYSDMDEVVFDINRQLDNAGIGGEVTAVADGDKVMFMSTKTGEETKLSASGADNGTLGFKTIPVTASGMDTTFEMGYSSFEGPVKTSYDNTAIGVGNHTYFVNGKSVSFSVAAGDTTQNIEDSINQALMDKGLGFTVYADVATGTSSDYKIDFKLQNTEMTDDTYLSTKLDTGTAADYQFATPRGTDYPTTDEKNVSDMLSYIQELYGGAVSASLSNGKLQVTDLRSGTSGMTFSVDEKNTGIGYAEVDQNVALSGRYTGTKDDKWNVNVDVTGTNLVLHVTDQRGNVIYDNTSSPIDTTAYKGSSIYIANGVSLTLGEINASTSFSIDMTANSNVSFGDLNVTEDGQNVDVFRSLTNLYDALNMNIPASGIGAPSAWSDTTLNSTAVPSLDGTFGGNYNDTLSFQVQYYNNQNSFYLQNDQTWSSQNVKYYDDANISFDLVLKSDKTTPAFTTKTFGAAAGTYANSKDLVDNLVTQINADSDLKNMGVKAYNNNGQLKIDTNSGNTEVSVSYNNDETAYVMGQSDTNISSSDAAPQTELTTDSALDIRYHDASGWHAQTVTVPAGSYSDKPAVVAALNAQITAAGITGVSASLSTNGTIQLDKSAGVTDIIASGDQSSELGFYTKAFGDTVTSDSAVTMDLTNKTATERSLTFSYYDGSQTQNVTVTADAENYASYDDLVANINQKLVDAGISGIVTAEKVGYNGLGFQFNGVSSTAVSGDYASTLGISKGGDIAKIKITGSNGELVNTYNMDTANKKYFVADGVYQYYDAGTLYATDSFTATVGSGINYELDVLDKAESQVLSSLTTVGNNQSKVDSAKTFNQNLVTNTDKLKANYTGSTTVDQTQATADLSTAQTAYQAALKVTATTMSISLLDYL